jgi:soluble lytic murein transglycosylase
MWFVVIAAVLVAAGLVIHSAKPAWYAKLWYPMNYSAAINREAGATGLDPALIAALIWRESDFEPASESHRGAVGLTQVLPSTAREIAAAHNAPVGRAADLADPEVNIAFGAWYLRQLIDRNNGSVEDGLAAYNAGAGNLTKWKQQALASGHTFRVPEDIPFPETKAYVEDILDAWSIYRRTYGDQLNPPT